MPSINTNASVGAINLRNSNSKLKITRWTRRNGFVYISLPPPSTDTVPSSGWLVTFLNGGPVIEALSTNRNGSVFFRRHLTPRGSVYDKRRNGFFVTKRAVLRPCFRGANERRLVLGKPRPRSRRVFDDRYSNRNSGSETRPRFCTFFFIRFLSPCLWFGEKTNIYVPVRY